jgi:hypothetical protein
MPVYVSGVYINDDSELVVDADEMADAGVRSVELIEGAPPTNAQQRGARFYDKIQAWAAKDVPSEEWGVWVREEFARQFTELEARLKCQTTALKQVNAELEAQLAEANARAEAAGKATFDHAREAIKSAVMLHCEAEFKKLLEPLTAEFEAATRRAEQAEAREADLAKALKVYANRSMWVKYERDGEDTASIFIGNEAGLEDGVLCDGWRFAQAALNPGARQEGEKE